MASLPGGSSAALHNVIIGTGPQDGCEAKPIMPHYVKAGQGNVLAAPGYKLFIFLKGVTNSKICYLVAIKLFERSRNFLREDQGERGLPEKNRD